MDNLALLYAHGQGVPKDEAEAESWFLKAAEAGAVDAQFQIAMDYDGGYHGLKKDKALATAWFRKAAEQGYAPAQFDLAMEIHEQDDETYFWLSLAVPNLEGDFQKKAAFFRDVAAAALKPGQRTEIDARVNQWQTDHKNHQ